MGPLLLNTVTTRRQGKNGECVSSSSSPLLSVMGPHFTLFLIVALSTSLSVSVYRRRSVYLPLFTSLLAGLQSASFQSAMDQLSVGSLRPGLPQEEFTELLRVFPTDSPMSLRADLGLVPDELCGVPLVDRPLRLISKVLSEDVWIIVHSICNNECMPRFSLK